MFNIVDKLASTSGTNRMIQKTQFSQGHWIVDKYCVSAHVEVIDVEPIYVI